MPTYHEAIAALPVGSAAVKASLRAMSVRRFGYCLTTAESLQTVTVVDPDAGTIPLVVVQNGLTFSYDSADTTTAHDGTTCLVSADGKRYKIDTFSYPSSVLDKDLTAPPGSPSVGDKYIVGTAATGAWSGHDGAVAFYASRGWIFATIPIGRPIYVEDETAFYHRNAGGTWTRGFGSLPFSANTIPRSAVIGQPFRHLVINQITNAPPGSPATADSYIVGSVPTGAWAGHAGKLAICEDGSTFTIYTPRTGELVFDIANNKDYRFNGTAWVSAFGAIIQIDQTFTASGSTSSGGSGSYTYSSGTAPTTSTAYFKDDGSTIDDFVAIGGTGATLKFTYDATITQNGLATTTIGLFRDSEANAIAWSPNFGDAVAEHRNYDFWVTAPDAAAHDYHIRGVGAVAASVNALTRRSLSVEEVA